MYLIVTYDVEAKRTEKFRKLLSRYLVHTQYSVFSGDITESETTHLRRQLSQLMITGDRVVEVATANRHNIEVHELQKSDSGKGEVARIPLNDHRRDFTVL
jgi:CRISPR-associated protein Cas2